MLQARNKVSNTEGGQGERDESIFAVPIICNLDDRKYFFISRFFFEVFVIFFFERKILLHVNENY